MHGTLFAHQPAESALAPRPGTPRFLEYRRKFRIGNARCLRVIGAILVTEENSRLGIAQLGCAVEDHLEHRLRIGRRAGNHAQNIGRSRLPLKRFLRLIE